MAEKVERELGWDDPIEDDGPDFIILPDGDYNFEIVDFERGRHPGSAKLPACNKAVISIQVEGEEGSTTIKHQLFLHTITESLLCQFFTGIGQRQKGERISMDWSKVIGSTGRCKIGTRKWVNDSGKELTFNEIKQFYEPDSKPKPKFEAGKF